MLGYKISDRMFNNPFAAFLWAAHNAPHVFPEFIVYDDIFSRHDWTIEPPQTWQELLRLRAVMLRQKYDRLVLAFSGGTDSMTCFRVFQELDIHIDEILITYSDDVLGNAPKENIQWLLANHHDPSTKITTWYRQDRQALTQYDTTEWLLRDQGHLRRFELTVPGSQVQEYLENQYAGHRWALITGHEKPHIFRRDHKWWATHLDGVYHAVLGWPNLEMFFVSPDLPELHIKQHHLLLHEIDRSGLDASDGWNSCRELGKKDAAAYHWFATSCGRCPDAVYGSSFAQKQYNQHTRIQDTDLLLDSKLSWALQLEPLLKASLDRGDTLAENYVDAWCAIQTDATVVNYMFRHQLLSRTQQMIANDNQIWSKFYLLRSDQ